ncbi:Glutamyl-tRNA(Gln) amidotransferase subunit B [Lachnellula suecica]|uniref:Glutamyl-tRNA(Gln) amidotransferase subunit B, mitochondrial n=1 Tax=Lachnellula suecica TaxID=602035 RepID=A0A8T9CDI7_9HELO|nr:Glutamyl-tRNA(Gln) amidotransferase subunit B [Lachnellula suecica]
MARIAPRVLRSYLLGGQVPARGCLCRRTATPARSAVLRRYHATQAIQPTAESAVPSAAIPFRKQLKDEAKQRKAEGGEKISKVDNQTLDDWELTVGIEIHAQLNTPRKLFSSAASTINDAPNTHVALFDVAMPGSQPTFQKETLIPALRAALALNCNIQKTSRFDRKHYFHWDQPSGYQITQFYEPFAKDGHITLYAHDGIAKEDGEQITIGIKQVQMEQDTAKTISQPGDIHLLDFNRVGLPLIEIITLPQIHHPSTAAALVRKVQIILESVDACVLGMQSGGLRADVNVSVRNREKDSLTTKAMENIGEGGHENSQVNGVDQEEESSPTETEGEEDRFGSYAGITGLGQRTEIKNLSSFKAVEDAIIAERDRQIRVLEFGGVIAGETRGWTIGSTETRRLRGKEGEVDYRYMPDPDLGPVIIGQDLINHLELNLGILPDAEISTLVEEYGLTPKDALSLVSLNEGGRHEYFRDVVDQLLLLPLDKDQDVAGKLCITWVLHEMGGLTHEDADEENPLRITRDGDCIIKAPELAVLIYYVQKNKITGKSAKKILAELFACGLRGEVRKTEELIDEAGLWFIPLSAAEYEELARSVLDMTVVEQILAGKGGKINFLVGQMMRKDGNGKVDPQEAMEALRKVIEEFRK